MAVEHAAQRHAGDTEPLGRLSNSKAELCQYVLPEDLAGMDRVAYHPHNVSRNDTRYNPSSPVVPNRVPL